MSYREENGQVVLTMHREDYQVLLIVLGYSYSASFWKSPDAPLAFMNRINEGNPNYTPYQVEEKKP